jgi:hypothetical protein
MELIRLANDYSAFASSAGASSALEAAFLPVRRNQQVP